MPRIQTRLVVVMAQMVPTGIDFWASSRSPDLLEPAIIPINTNIHIHLRYTNTVEIYIYS